MNIDSRVVEEFGDEWKKFKQDQLSDSELSMLFNSYFSIFPWDSLSENSKGFDLGCGSGRWAKLVAPRVGILHCIDPSSAIEVAKANLVNNSNCIFHQASVDKIPLTDNSMDFGYSLGVLHHVPDTQSGIADCVKKLKPKAPFLLYLYYAFDNKPVWFRLIWATSDIFRKIICLMPFKIKLILTTLIATFVYYPLAVISRMLEMVGINAANIPLNAYRDCSFYTMRTDALDRFGTRLEQRFTKTQINQMMCNAGLENIEFSNNLPYWVAIGVKK
jgi:ubiquinone/menaquinone biosynthesis C-methylase UbiE